MMANRINYSNLGLNRRTFKNWNKLRILIIISICIFIVMLIFNKSEKEKNNKAIDQKDQIEDTDINNIVETLYANVKILCIIFSSKKEIFDRAFHVHKTWAKRCNRHVFLTYYDKFKLPYLDFQLPDTREVLWKKVRLALKWVNENELNNYDYILRTDDDSYFIMENLRFFLLPFNPNEPLYFGARFKENNTAYMSGGAGYILSRNTNYFGQKSHIFCDNNGVGPISCKDSAYANVAILRESVKQIAASLDNPNICSQPTDKNFHDDYEIGVCVKNLNITSVDTRDNKGRHRMLPWSPAVHFITGLEDRHFKWLYYPYNQSTTFECCAEHMISFHYVYNEMLYVLEFLTYNMRLIGSMDKYWQKINNKNQKINLLERLKLASKTISNT